MDDLFLNTIFLLTCHNSSMFNICFIKSYLDFQISFSSRYIRVKAMPTRRRCLKARYPSASKRRIFVLHITKYSSYFINVLVLHFNRLTASKCARVKQLCRLQRAITADLNEYKPTDPLLGLAVGLQIETNESSLIHIHKCHALTACCLNADISTTHHIMKHDSHDQTCKYRSFSEF